MPIGKCRSRNPDRKSRSEIPIGNPDRAENKRFSGSGIFGPDRFWSELANSPLRWNFRIRIGRKSRSGNADRDRDFGEFCTLPKFRKSWFLFNYLFIQLKCRSGFPDRQIRISGSEGLHAARYWTELANTPLRSGSGSGFPPPDIGEIPIGKSRSAFPDRHFPIPIGISRSGFPADPDPENPS